MGEQLLLLLFHGIATLQSSVTPTLTHKQQLFPTLEAPSLVGCYLTRSLVAFDPFGHPHFSSPNCAQFYKLLSESRSGTCRAFKICRCFQLSSPFLS